jgi:hypothetical protein
MTNKDFKKISLKFLEYLERTANKAFNNIVLDTINNISNNNIKLILFNVFIYTNVFYLKKFYYSQLQFKDIAKNSILDYRNNTDLDKRRQDDN